MRSIHVLAFLLLDGACVGELLTVRVEQQASTEIAGAGLLGEVLDALDLGGFDELSVEIDRELANQGAAPGDVTSVRLAELTLSNPDAEDLSFLSAISFTVSAPGLDPVRIAHAEDFPEGQRSVSLALDDVDLADFVVAESMTITTSAQGEAPADDTTIRAFLALDIQASAQGACRAAQEQAQQGDSGP